MTKKGTRNTVSAELIIIFKNWRAAYKYVSGD